jgi:hypothetical protein
MAPPTRGMKWHKSMAHHFDKEGERAWERRMRNNNEIPTI